ncbi:MAG: NADPH-dependent FMN reductase [Luteibaculaceae bacterium]
MITLIAGTNRSNSKTSLVIKSISNMLQSRDIEHQIIDLSEINPGFYFPEMYTHRSEEITEIVEKILVPTDTFLFVLPEYNGGFPGALKLFIDACPPSVFHFKKAAMIGISSGKFGCLRGLEHLTGVLQYLKMNVIYHKPTLSGIDIAFDSKTTSFTNEFYQNLIVELLDILESKAKTI